MRVLKDVGPASGVMSRGGAVTAMTHGEGGGGCQGVLGGGLVVITPCQ